MEKTIQKDSMKFIPLVIIVSAILLILVLSIYTIGAGERGVLLTFGKPSMDAVGEGLHFKFPFAQTVKKLDVKITKLEKATDSTSKDLQDVQTTIALNYHLSPEQTPSLYQQIGVAYEDRIISPAIEETVKAVSAKFSAEELVTKRPEVRNQIQDSLRIRLAKSFIIVDDFNIVNFQFSAEFDKAIEQKVTAEQLKLKAEMDLERIKIEKEQIITKAQAEAESLRLQKQEITRDLIELRQIEVQRTAIEKWNGILPQVTGGAIPFIDMRTTNSSL